MLHHLQAPPRYVDGPEHLPTDCADCAASLASPNTPVPVSDAARSEVGACLPAGSLGSFVLNELREPERRHVEKHCALCEPCGEQLVEVFRALVLPVDAAEQAYFTDGSLLTKKLELPIAN